MFFIFSNTIELILTSLFTVLAVCVGYYTLKIYNLRKRYAHIPGPPANGLIGFYLGNVIELYRNEKINKKVNNDLILEWFFILFQLKTLKLWVQDI